MSSLDLVLIDTADAVPFSVRLAQQRALIQPQQTPSPQDRRAYTRRTSKDLEWLESVRLTGGTGYGVRLIDLSEGGALLEVDAPLRPGVKLVLELSGRNIDTRVSLEVLRSYIANLGGTTALYRGACAFDHLIQLPSSQPLAPNPALPTFVGTDAALLYLHARAHAMDSRQILHVLGALHMRAAVQGSATRREHADDLLAAIVPPLQRAAPREDAIAILYGCLRGLPENVQPRMQETTSRLLALIDRCATAATIEAAEAPEDTTTPDVVEPAVKGTEEAPTTFQRLVVRYTDGKIAKGFSQDFHPSRSQFSLWPAINASPSERTIVQVPKLKAIFFVKDFNGNPGYRERKSFTARTQGRRVEVTFLDTEVILGTTLNYRPDGQGFFVSPVDPSANNTRIFVVAAAVKRVRFL
jgi:hypothetical protein